MVLITKCAESSALFARFHMAEESIKKGNTPFYFIDFLLSGR